MRHRLLARGSLLCLSLLEVLGWLPGLSGSRVTAADVPALPMVNAAVEIPAQEWPLRPGPRSIRVRICYPGGERKNISANTGLFLTLHNWGGSDCIGTADPQQLANRCDCVALCVDYLQSGPKDSIEGPEPYDFGWLQALDALRALHFVWDGLRTERIAFHDGRIYATGGSGGGNVTLMANKLAPRTFAAVVDLCGMPKLSDDIAFNLPGGSELNARYSREPASPNHLSRDAQEVRFIGHPEHLAKMQELQSSAKVYIVHGATDGVCPIGDAREMIANFQKSGLDVIPKIVEQSDIDGKVFASTGHSLGNRTEIVFAVAGEAIDPQGAQRVVRTGPTDFEHRDQLVRYRTSRGEWVVSYQTGFPVGQFEPDPPAPHYAEHLDLTYRLDAANRKQPLKSVDEWKSRRRQIVEQFESAAGEFPGPAAKVPLELEVLEESQVGGLTRRKVRYRSDHFDRVSAWLFLPGAPTGERRPAILCLQQTTAVGKDEPAGLAGDPGLHYALELAKRGFVTLSPDYPSFGEHTYDFDQHPEYASGTMKAIWDNVRAVDLLQTFPEVDGDRIGCLGHSLGGHNAIFTALFEPRIQAVVSSCGFCTFTKDDIPSWTGPRYMPRIATRFENDIAKVPFDFTELIAAIAPRPFLACAATRDNDFDVAGVKLVMRSAQTVYELHGAGASLQADYPEAIHSFPAESREKAYRFLEESLRRASGAGR
ncbi:MAG: prolyl oligopeptidase family serine peptidase [Planctomycetota bacterium]|nr:prolyl oligopeptidase family serine peptidase [Planctomycetota bacterium]